MQSIFQKNDFSDSDYIETSILDIFHHVVIANQWTGLVPLSIATFTNKDGRQERTLYFRFLSVPYLWSITLMAMSLVATYLWITLLEELENAVQGMMDTSTAHWMTTFSSFFFTILMAFQRVYGLFAPKEPLKVWKGLIQKMEEISQSCSDGSFRIASGKAKHCGIFLKIKRTVRRATLYYVVFVLIQLVLPNIVLLLEQLGWMTNASTKTISCIGMLLLYILVTTFWACLCLIHWYVFVWIVMPLKLAKGCLQMIWKELEDMRNYAELKQKLTKESKLIYKLKLNQISTLGSPSVDEDFTPLPWEKNLTSCIQNFYSIQALVEMYSNHFNHRIIFDIFACSVIILGNAFMGILFMEAGRFFDSYLCLIASVTALKVVYDLGSNAGQLGTECDLILDQLCQFPTHLISGEAKQRVSGVNAR
jgi:hypothetical protein